MSSEHLAQFGRRYTDSALSEALSALGTAGPGTPPLDAHALARRLGALTEAAQKSREPLSLELMLTRIVALITDAFDAERSTLFLYDADSDELFSRVAQGRLVREIRFSARSGIAGAVFLTGEPEIIADPYADTRFNQAIDLETGFRTQSILCVPVRSWRGETIGVTEVLNKRSGPFTPADAVLLQAFTAHMSTAIENAHLFERARVSTREESQLMEVTQALSSELDIDTLLRKIMSIATELLDAERSTLFLHDPVRNELWSRIAEGVGAKELRIPADTGIAGEAFTRRTPINIQDAYGDPRFNPEIDRRTGFRTRSILCVPVINKLGLATGIMQVLNHRHGVFSLRDQRRLELLAAQSAIALENARLFQEVLQERNYNDNVLRSLTNGVLTLDLALNVVKVNDAAATLIGREPGRLLGASVEDVFGNGRAWVRRAVKRVAASGTSDVTMDGLLRGADGNGTSVNLIVSPLRDPESRVIGYTLVMEDITKEKRVRAAMARYMTREVAEQVLAQGEAVIGGRFQLATVLFTDIADFTTIAERIGAQETLALLNTHFGEMVEVLFAHGGILDKFIGDGLMAVFGTPFPGAQDADNAIAAAIRMQEALALFNRRRTAAGTPPLAMRIGINSDQVVAGNVGSSRRMDYTVIGDGVNLASRLEGANKVFGTRILTSGLTVALLKERYVLRELDLLRVKGKANPVAVYEVLGFADRELPSGRAELLGHFARGLASYRGRSFGAAIAHFERALAVDPRDRPSLIFQRRARRYDAVPPPEPWDGVWSLGTK
ncbi:MAG: GAF domain-containing protein [Gammaproteobacteria bacterium]|nr:GAF domain-containing protein [Gammaproteobacteria bacterium]